MMNLGLMSMLMVGLLGANSGLVGFPAGERDDAYVNCAPAETLVYVEWSTRGEGEAGAEGIDGLVADPEVTAMVDDLKSALMKFVENEQGGPPPVFKEHVPPLILDLVNRSGCLYVSYDPPENVEERLQEENWLDLASGASVTLIINGGDKADETEKHLLALLEMAPLGQAPPEAIDEIAIPNPFGLEATFDREGDYFILALGEGSLERAHAGLKGEVKGLAESEAFAKNFDTVKMERLGGLFWINIGSLRDEGLKLAGPFGQIGSVMIQQLGLDQLNGCMTVSGVVDGQIATRTLLETGGKTEGVLSLVAGRGLSQDDFKNIPGDCDLLASFTLDLPHVRTAITSLIEEIQPGLMENFNAIEGQAESELGFSIEEEFLKAYGQQMTVFDSPAAGGLFLTSLTLSVEVLDQEKADPIYEKLMMMLKATLPGDRSNEYSRRGVFLEEREFMGHTLYFVNTIGDDDVPFAPAFCQTEQQLLVSLHPQALKAHLRFLKEGGPSYADRFQPEGAEGAVISYASFSAEKMVELIYAVIPFAAQVGLSNVQGEGFEFDIFSIPSSKAILPYMKEARSWTTRTESGLIFESRSSLPAAFTSLPVNAIYMLVPSRSRATFERVDEAIIEEGN